MANPQVRSGRNQEMGNRLSDLSQEFESQNQPWQSHPSEPN